MKLYDATDQLLTIREWMDEPENAEKLIAAGGDLDAVPELAELADKAEGDFATKMERVALYVRELLATAEVQRATAKAINAVAAPHSARASSIESAAAGLKEYMRRNLARLNRPKVEGELVDVRRQLSGASVKHELSPEQLAALHKDGCIFTVERVSHELPADALRDAYKLAVAEVGARPKPGEEDFDERLAEWLATVRVALVEEYGVPRGVTVEQKEHLRIV